MKKLEIGNLFKEKQKTEDLDRNLTFNHKWKIAVVGISQGAGATFIATSLAFLMSKKVASGCVAYVELEPVLRGRPMAYFSAGLDRCFSRKSFTDFFSSSVLERKEKTGKKKLNYYKGINWIVRKEIFKENFGGNPEESTVDFPLNEVAGSHVIVDRAGLSSLHKYDLVIGVFSPRPSMLLAGAETYEILRDSQMSGVPVLWLCNGDHEGVCHEEVKRFLKLGKWDSVGMVPGELFDSAEFSGKLPVELLQDDKVLEDLKKLTEAVLAKTGRGQ